jgi:hypothetical protein
MSRKRNGKLPPEVTPADPQAMDLYGISAEEIATRCGVDLATARRWKRGATRIPRTAVAVLLGDLGAIDPHFRGWKIEHGEIISPEGWRFGPGEVLSLPLLRQQLAAYQATERVADGLPEQPQPGDIPAIRVVA